MIFNPHKLGVHKVLQHIPLNVVFDAPYKRALKKAVNIADLRLIAKARAHKVSTTRWGSSIELMRMNFCRPLDRSHLSLKRFPPFRPCIY
jgi:hypothetical protein